MPEEKSKGKVADVENSASKNAIVKFIEAHEKVIEFVLSVMAVGIGIGIILSLAGGGDAQDEPEADIFTQTEQLQLAGNDAEAVELWLQAVEDASTDEELAEAYRELGSTYMNTEEFDKALAAFEMISTFEVEKIPGLSYSLAVAAELSGNTDKALTYYTEYLEHLKSQLEIAEGPEKEGFQVEVDALEGYLNDLGN